MAVESFTSLKIRFDRLKVRVTLAAYLEEMIRFNGEIVAWQLIGIFTVKT